MLPDVFAADAAEQLVSDSSGTPETASATGTASLLVRTVWETDRTLAADVRLKLFRHELADAHFHAIDGVTDARGEWRCDGLAPGRVGVLTDRSVGGRADLWAGKLVTLELVMPAGLTVSGVVVDGERRPAEGASIWLSASDDVSWLVARADAEGRFAIRDIMEWRYLGATLPGHSPSGRMLLRQETVDLTLVLGPPGGAVHGIVLDPSGQPIADGNVELGGDYGWPDPYRSSEMGFVPPMQAISTDTGEFRFEDVQVGLTRVSVRADSWSPWEQNLAIEAGQVCEVVATLQPEAVLTGTVVDGSGRPMAGVTVSFRQLGNFDHVEVESAADGQYELHGMSLGKQEVRAEMKGLGRDVATFEFQPGERYTWDPVLAVGAAIVGRVVDAEGRPVGGLLVRGVLESGESTGRRQATTGADGRFALNDCERGSYHVDIWSPEPLPLAIAAASSVVPGGHELEFLVPVDPRASALVTAALHAPSGEMIGQAKCWLVHELSGLKVEGKFSPSGSALQVGPVPPGDYELSVRASGFPKRTLPVQGLAPDERRDLGAVVLEAPASLAVSVSVPDGIDPASVSARLLGGKEREGGNLVRQADGSFLSPPVSEGEFLLEVHARHAATLQKAVNLRSGERTEIAVALSKGVAHQVELTMPLADGPPPEVWAEVLDGEGALVARQPAMVVDEVETNRRRAVAAFRLACDTYRLRFSVAGSVAVEALLHVEETGKAVAVSTYEVP